MPASLQEIPHQGSTSFLMFLAAYPNALTAISASNQKHRSETIGRWYGDTFDQLSLRRATSPDAALTLTRFTSRAAAAIVTARQFSVSDRGGLSMSSDSSILCGKPGLVWAVQFHHRKMKEDNSRSARYVCSS
jgi:hypothetical protein